MRIKRDMNKRLQHKYGALLAQAGVEINGANAWDIRVHNPAVYRRVMLRGSLGLGEAYMDGWWDCERLDQLFTRLLTAGLDRRTVSAVDLLDLVQSLLLNLQKAGRAFHVGERHYDLSTQLFENMLDSRMNYSCGYWKDAQNLDDAQQAKLRLIFDKLGLRPGMKVLDIGCGWGGAARFAAEQYGVSVAGITVSQRQSEYARAACRGLPVEIRLQDYRDLGGEYDRVYSIGMFEHVGHKNYRTYLDAARRVLKKDGLFLLHTIGSSYSLTRTDPWIERYIFPNSMLPSLAQISRACEGRFVMEDVQNFGADYDKTLTAWHRNFLKNRGRIEQAADERFCRMWEYYLLSCAGSFRSRSNQLWQFVLSPNGVTGCYHAPR